MRTLNQLVGTTGSTSGSLYPASFTSLAQNNSSQNVALGKQLINDQQRYLLQKYFDNERTFSFSTLGAQSLTTTASLASGATSATLTSAWTYASCQQFVNFSSGDQRLVKFIYNSTAITWQVGLSTTATTAITTVGLRDYPIPANVSKIKSFTVQVGQLQYQPKPVQTLAEWNVINTLPYTSDIPNYFFPWNGTVGIFPIPSTTGNPVNLGYKTRVPDLTFADYSTGNVTAMAVGGYSVTGATTAWNSTGGYPLNTDITFLNLNLRVDPPYGDGLWYPIQSFQSDTALTLALPVVNAPNITAASTYTIAQLPILQEDFQDMLVWGSLMTYFSTIVKDPQKYQEYEREYNRRLDLLKDYAGTKSVNVDLEDEPPMFNTNLFIYKQS